jgi:hypothetical protein
MAPMTVCIAAICERGKAIVLAADRLCWAPYTGLETELEDRKIILLSQRIALLGAGTLENSNEIRRRLRASDCLTRPIPDIAVECLSVCQDMGFELIKGIGRRSFGLVGDELKDSAKSGMEKFFSSAINAREAPVESSVVLAGLDADGAHVYYINQREKNRHNELGFAATGIGATQVAYALTARQHRKSDGLEDTLYNVFAAKRCSELVNGVGKTTDIAILRSGARARFLGRSALAKLDLIHRSIYPPRLSEKNRKTIASLLS